MDVIVQKSCTKPLKWDWEVFAPSGSLKFLENLFILHQSWMPWITKTLKSYRQITYMTESGGSAHCHYVLSWWSWEVTPCQYETRAFQKMQLCRLLKWAKHWRVEHREIDTWLDRQTDRRTDRQKWSLHVTLHRQAAQKWYISALNRWCTVWDKWKSILSLFFLCQTCAAIWCWRFN